MYLTALGAYGLLEDYYAMDLFIHYRLEKILELVL